MEELIKWAWNVTDTFSWIAADFENPTYEGRLVDQDFPQNGSFVVPVLSYDPNLIVYLLSFEGYPCQMVLRYDGTIEIGDL